jgi:hypothetical protein
MLINNQRISNIIESNGGAKMAKWLARRLRAAWRLSQRKWHQNQKIISNGMSENNNKGMANENGEMAKAKISLAIVKAA